jgi:hypothetical protein
MKRLLGFLAMAGLMMLAAPVERAQAVSLINPAAAAQSKYLSDNLVVEVRHRGGFRGGFRGGGVRFGGHRHFGHRHVHFHRPHFHRRHVFFRPRPVIYPYYVARPRLYCRWFYTDFGPRRICRYRPWWV